MITGLSVAVAFLVGAFELAGVLASELHLRGPLGRALSSIDLNLVGFAVAALFAAAWAVAVLVWRLGDVEGRWAGQLRDARQPS